MTAKRFEMGYDDGLLRFVKDNATNTNLDIVDCWTVLNELNDENEQLYYEIQKVAESNECLLTQKRRWEECSDKYAELYEENKQLKEKNKQLLAKLKYTCEKINFSERLREMMK